MAEMLGTIYRVVLFDERVKGKRKSRQILAKGLAGEKMPEFEEVFKSITESLAGFEGLAVTRKTKK